MSIPSDVGVGNTEVRIRQDCPPLEDQTDLEKGRKKCHSLEVSVGPTDNQGVYSENFPADEIDIPNVSLNAPNDEVVVPMENFSGGVRFEGISDRCA